MGAQVISTSERFKFNHVYDFYIGKDALFGHIVINKDMKFTIPNFFKNGFTKEYLEGYLEGVEHMSKDWSISKFEEMKKTHSQEKLDCMLGIWIGLYRMTRSLVLYGKVRLFCEHGYEEYGFVIAKFLDRMVNK